MPAWSLPGTHRVILPLIRLNLVMASSTLLVRAWPKCNFPVTLGGGITIMKTPSGGASLTLFRPYSGLKKPSFSHQEYLEEKLRHYLVNSFQPTRQPQHIEGYMHLEEDKMCLSSLPALFCLCTILFPCPLSPSWASCSPSPLSSQDSALQLPPLLF